MLSEGTIVFKGLAEKRWAFCFSQRDVQRDVCVQIKPISEILVTPRLVVRKSLSSLLTDFSLILSRFYRNCAFRNWFAASISACTKASPHALRSARLSRYVIKSSNAFFCSAVQGAGFFISSVLRRTFKLRMSIFQSSQSLFNLSQFKNAPVTVDEGHNSCCF